MISVEQITDKSVFMSKVDSFNILLCGDKDAVSKFRKYLGFYKDEKYKDITPSQKAMVYFEFPNEKFAYKKFLNLFKYKLKMYLLQPTLLENSHFLMSVYNISQKSAKFANLMFLCSWSEWIAMGGLLDEI